VLGVDGAIDLLLTFGGAEVYWAEDPAGGSAIAQRYGIEAARKLSRAAGGMKQKLPVGKPWIARVWSARGIPVAEIARRLHSTDTSVRAWLAQGVDGRRGAQAADPRQLHFFDAVEPGIRKRLRM
jgi:hypothetical protein